MWNRSVLSFCACDINATRTVANLPQELRLSDLRRTGTTEMVDAGVGIAQIMSVTGHANPQSVKPYMKNTYMSANNALTTRKMHVISTDK